ncbi:hypothetical protein Dda_3733 [Drechslerella dactyloides]|uniref:Tyrosine decarboxylase n=1 Tax=Drechslerella dactyloides TaxID=74499 RepID=A0AAD6NLE9_DREDA|nr:hypothetical protein Dda_3733 [Drechslerella dactyloides]
MANPFAVTEADFSALLQQIHKAVTEYYISNPPESIRPPEAILQNSSPADPPARKLKYPIGLQGVVNDLIENVLPGVFAQSHPNFYGFVTGGVLPPALLADFMVSLMDLNVMVHLPNDSIHTTIEHHTIQMLCDMFHLPRWMAPGSAITTGATASNILGLACAREWTLTRTEPNLSVARRGFAQACQRAGLTSGIGILCASPHSSLKKAASIVGLGSDNVIDIADPQTPWDFNLENLEGLLAKQKDTRWIVVGQLGEVNTGQFMSRLPAIRRLCDKYNSWLHIDAAFGLPARCVKAYDKPTEDLANWDRIFNWCNGVELADSIASDGHKLMNVPYDAGLFFSKHRNILYEVFKNPGAAYLATGLTEVEAPCDINIENSRRFRALPLYAALTALGAPGYSALIRRLVLHARKIAAIIESEPLLSVYEVAMPRLEDIFNVVLFRARDPALNEVLAGKINATGKMWVSGTQWRGSKAVRIAVANWRVSIEEDGPGSPAVVREVLKEVAGI